MLYLYTVITLQIAITQIGIVWRLQKWSVLFSITMSCIYLSDLAKRIFG